MSDIPKSSGAYWWRANDECDWDPVYIREDSTVPGYEFTVLFPETGVEIDLPDMRGQWAKAHSPDDGVEAWAVFAPSGRLWVGSQSELDAIACAERTSGPNHIMWTELAKRGFTRELVTIYRKEKE